MNGHTRMQWRPKVSKLSVTTRCSIFQVRIVHSCQGPQLCYKMTISFKVISCCFLLLRIKWSRDTDPIEVFLTNLGNKYSKTVTLEQYQFQSWHFYFPQILTVPTVILLLEFMSVTYCTMSRLNSMSLISEQ